MSWTAAIEHFGSEATPWVNLGANFLLQSTILIGTGLLLARCLRARGAALESAILRATLDPTGSRPRASTQRMSARFAEPTISSQSARSASGYRTPSGCST